MVIRGYAGEYYAQTPQLIFAGPFNNFRDPAGDLSVTLGSRAFVVPTGSTFNQAAFDTANPQYAAIVGGAGVTPNTVYRQFAILGINLNTLGLGKLPTLTPTQVSTITSTLNKFVTPAPAAGFGIFAAADYVGMTSNFRNPQSFQWGFGIQREVAKDITVGVDWSQVNTSNLERYRDINMPAGSSTDPSTGRVIYNRNNRPVPQIGRLSIRESSAKSLYRGLTFRTSITRRLFRLDAYYTWSQSFSDDDNERDATGVLYDNPADFTSEYWYSRLDRRHIFTAAPVFYLPHGFEVSSGMNFRSGTPITATVGSDLNGDANTNERPFSAFGVEYKRDSFRQPAIYDMSMRVQKGFKFGETKRLVLSWEIFNLLNRSNMQYAGTDVTNFCRTTVDVTGQAAAVPIARCGIDGPTNVNFLHLYDQKEFRNGVSNANLNKLNLSNSPGSQVQTMQLGARFYF